MIVGGGSKEGSMKRLIAALLILGGFALSGCVYEVHHDRAVTREVRTQNEDGTTTVTRTEVVSEPDYYPSTGVYVSPWWGWGFYPYYYYRPYPGFGYYHGYRPYYYHRR
jgi:hypothetical protein